MSQNPSDPGRKKTRVDRRAPRGSTGSLRWVKGLLGRPLVLERRGSKLHLTLVDRRRPAAVLEADDLSALRAELRARLLEHDNHHTAAVMRHLVLVHDVLGRRGWSGVAAMDSRVLHKAQIQAQMLASEEPSRRLSLLSQRLTVLQVTASVREDRGADGDSEETTPDWQTTALPVQRAGATRIDLDLDAPVEISEGSAEEFDAIERGWLATQSPPVDVEIGPAETETAPGGTTTTGR